MEPSPSTWIRFPSFAVWPPSSLRRVITPSGTPACSGQPVNGRSRIVPQAEETAQDKVTGKKKRGSRYRTWGELLRRTFGLDGLACAVCKGRMKLVAVFKDPESVARYIEAETSC